MNVRLYAHNEKAWNRGRPAHEWPAHRNDLKTATTAHPGGHKGIQDNVESVHNSTMRKRLGKHDINSRVADHKG